MAGAYEDGYRSMVLNAILDALRMDLPEKVTVRRIERFLDPNTYGQCTWAVSFIMPGMREAGVIEIKQHETTAFPYDEVLTKIRLFC